jgi:predicted RNA-binding Zn-ribbon protein involved in translation (DUF1610 family)
MRSNPPPRLARRVDANHAEVRDTLREKGYSVLDLSGAGDGCPDICVGATIAGSPWNLFFEIKVAGGKLTPAQIRWHDEWQGQVAVITSADEAIRIIERERVVKCPACGVRLSDCVHGREEPK